MEGPCSSMNSTIVTTWRPLLNIPYTFLKKFRWNSYSDSRESGIVPAFDLASINEPLELSLGQASSDEIESGELVDGDWSEIAHLDNPIMLCYKNVM